MCLFFWVALGIDTASRGAANELQRSSYEEAHETIQVKDGLDISSGDSREVPATETPLARSRSRQLLSTAAEVVSTSTLKKAIAAAAANDVIVVRASFIVSLAIKVEKSLRSQASVSNVTIGFTGASPPLTTNGIRVFGTSKLKVSF
eukprot:jgi/Mesen1/9006/ME000563S08328